MVQTDDHASGLSAKTMSAEVRATHTSTAVPTKADVPDADPDLLRELGWAQFQLGKLVEARKMTLAALEHAGRPGHYAAASYNLGRMEEAAGNERIAAAD